MAAKTIVDFANLIKDYTKKLVHWGDQSKGYVGKNIADSRNIEAGIAWNGDTNSARARWIIPIEENTSYIATYSGSYGLDFVGYITSSTPIPSAGSLIGVNSWPVNFTSNAGDKYVIFGFNKTSITKDDVEALKFMIRDASIPDSTYEPYLTPNTDLMSYADNAVLGARNIYNAYKPKKQGVTPVVSDNGKSINIADSTSVSYNSSGTEQTVEPNTQYKVICDVVVTSGAGRIKIEKNGTALNQTAWITSSGHYEFEFNSGNNTTLDVTLFCTGSTATAGDVTYNNLMIGVPSDTYNTFTSYAMSNRELTNKVLKSATFSGTTSANGNMPLHNGMDRIILGVICSGYLASPYIDNNNFQCHFTKIAQTNYEVVANTAVSGTYYYIQI